MRVLQDAGFESPRVDLVPQVWRLRSPEALFEIMLHSTVRTAALLGAQTPHALDAIRDELRNAKDRRCDKHCEKCSAPLKPARFKHGACFA